MLIIATSISGSGRKEYLQEFEQYAKARRKKVRVYYIGDLLFEQAKKIGISITPENVLNTNPYVLSSLRSAVFENLFANLEKDLKQNDAVIISFHAFFLWKKIFTRAYDRFSISNFNTDAFVTFIGDPLKIKGDLDAREQWKSEKLSIEEILLWQNVEGEVTSSWADMYMKPFYTISVRQPISTFFRLVFHPEYEPVYISMPITYLRSKKDQAKVDKFVEKLNDYFVVFDPRLLEGTEIAVNLRNKKTNLMLYNQIVNRDLYYLVKQSKKIIAFFPKIVSSPGVINELKEAHETNKDVWVIWPEKRGSPFLTYFSDKVFPNEKEFFNFLDQHYKKHNSAN